MAIGLSAGTSSSQQKVSSMASLPVDPAARDAQRPGGALAARWPLPDLDQILRIADGFARAIGAEALGEGQLFLAEREYNRLRVRPGAFPLREERPPER